MKGGSETSSHLKNIIIQVHKYGGDICFHFYAAL